jgi:hypothetical protein
MGAVTPRAFTMLVIMAVVTTLATSPALAALGYAGACRVMKSAFERSDAHFSRDRGKSREA